MYVKVTESSDDFLRQSTGQPALAGTPSYELKVFVGAVLLPTCP